MRKKQEDKKLWILRPRNELLGENSLWNYDCAYGFVVRGINEKEARELANVHAGDEKDIKVNPWLDPKCTTCKVLTAKGKTEVIIIDFLNG